MIYNDLRTMKTLLDLDPGDTSQDKKLNFFNEYAAGIIEELLDRDFTYKARTRFYDGTGTQKLCLRHRPVYPAPPAGYSALSVVIDESGEWGEASGSFTNTALTYGTDYSLKLDMDDGGSRSGILYRINDYWPKPQVRQRGLLTPFLGPDMGSIKVTYTAGYTADTLPANIRLAAELIIARLNQLFPLGLIASGESYSDTAGSISHSILQPWHDLLTGLAKPLLYNFRNWGKF